MPWPDPLGQLLVRSDSRASQALRWGLRGLRASLQGVLDDVPDDLTVGRRNAAILRVAREGKGHQQA